MIVIHAKGNSQLGIGNLSRAYELINYLSNTKRIIGIFECEENIFRRYANKNIFRSNSLIESIKIIEENKCSIYISDLVNPDKKLSNKLRRLNVEFILHFNGVDFGFEPDILFVTDSFDYEFSDKRFKIYRGFEYYIVGNNILRNRKEKIIPTKSIKNILICFGGSDPAFFTEYLVQRIDDSIYNYSIVLGPAMTDSRKEYIKSIKKENITCIDSPLNMIDLYKKNDLLVTLGGMMTYEAMCLGLPVCAVRWSYLGYIVKGFGERNMITDLGNIEEAYQNLLTLDVNNLYTICQNAYNIIDGSALKNIETVINSLRGDKL